MKRIKLVGLTLLAMLVLFAVTAVSASALPEITKPGTTTKVSGEITGASEVGTTTTLETAAGTTITCTSAASKGGKFTDTKNSEGTVVTFKGCKESLFGGSCKSTEPKATNEGEIITKPLFGRVGYVTGKSPEVGLELAVNKENLEATYTTISCLGGFAKIEVIGSVIGQLGSGEANKSTTSLKLVFEKGTTKGSQKLTSIEGGFMTTTGLKSKLNTGGFEASNQQGKGTVKFAEAAELKA